MLRRFYFQKYEKQQSPDDLLQRLNYEAIKPKFIDDIITNFKSKKREKIIQNYRQRGSKSLDPIRNIRMDNQKLQEEYFKFLKNTEKGPEINMQNNQSNQKKDFPQQKALCLSKVLSLKYQNYNPFENAQIIFE